MKHHLDLFDAAYTTHYTSLRIQLNLVLGKFAAYGGEVPLTKKELAEEMGCTQDRVRRLLAEAHSEGFISFKNNKLFLNKFIDFNDAEEMKKKGYVKHFAFLQSVEFQSESRPVQRFVLEMLRHRFYMKSVPHYVTRVSRLYHSSPYKPGVFNIYSLKQMLDIIKAAQKYLHIELVERELRDWSIRVTAIKEEWLELGEIDSVGACTWITKKLSLYGYCTEFIDASCIQQLAKVMEFYYHQVGYEQSSKLFDISLSQLQRNSQTFYNLIYTTHPDKKVLDEISAYFKAVMEQAEMNQVEQLVFSFEQFDQACEKLEMEMDHKEDHNLPIPSHMPELLSLTKQRRLHLKQAIRNFELYWIQEFKQGQNSRSRVYYKQGHYPNVFQHMPELLTCYTVHREVNIRLK
ncbi:hypothetical protein L2089_15330 [Paenibacillus hunanensis]|uniref:hypothetical protein n=1 Tax=Paenibacillus hunanensis TaxID=539262 RepID=UPI0020273A37|nr:hypothetical protein [Paenibacillus hunanensis]MCL9662065.1 hypothetical protein [Paenibacillus hunanensis]